MVGSLGVSPGLVLRTLTSAILHTGGTGLWVPQTPRHRRGRYAARGPVPFHPRRFGGSLGVSPGLVLRTLTSAILGLGSLGPNYALALRASLVSYAG